MAPDGGLLDIHVTAFLSAIDGLLTAGRSSAPTRVLVPMKGVVTSTTAIIDDVRSYEQRPSRADVDIEILRSLRERAEATLTNLVAASKTHATSSGMSPVSLLDAAASHVSVTLTEIAKMICIRKASRAEQEDFASCSSSGPLSYTSSARSVEDTRPVYKRRPSELNTKRSEDVVSPPMSAASRFAEVHSRRTPSEPSSSLTSSPPPIFDKSPITSALGGISDDSAPPEGSEDAWSELKVSSLYIQHLLSDRLALVALSRSSNRGYRLCNTKCPFWGTQPRATTDVERECDSNNHNRVEHCLGLSRKPPARVRTAGIRAAAGAGRARAEVVGGAGATRGYEGIAASHGKVKLCGGERNEGAYEVVMEL